MRKLLTATFLFFTLILSAQDFGLSAEIRPRYENAHGIKSLLETDADGANFVSQRTRLNVSFAYNKIRLGISLQNVRVWGDVSTLSKDDTNIGFHQAWAEALLSEKFSVQLGRQVIAYDNERIFGGVAWAQSARSHDALVAHWKVGEKSKLDFGLALNADSESNIVQPYSNVAGYKAFQYAWYHTDFDNLGLSFLLLNNGVEYEDTNMDLEVDYSQTIGSYLNYKKGKFNADFQIYFQTGDLNGNSVSAMNVGGNVGYSLSDNFALGLGGEYFSGKDMTDTSSDVKSFNPLFGTNHKFNGLMDYFYVGNHIGSVGLIDIYGHVAYKKDKFNAKLAPHFFSAPATVHDGSMEFDSALGTELDLTMGYNISKSFSVAGGHSAMFATESMEVLKGGDKDEYNSWTWLMVTFKPTLFESKAKK
ncbi:MAG: hypothetical protein BM563_04365 [Bacteroidetes bacterium MedPE-SWsnd-G1]|nr:MAG: hypothetical protein BM563_04365 [Bacteroidetes bacterium MedPE-SWsnd-G1]